MPNTQEYADWLTMASLDILESKRAVSHFFNKEWSKEFNRNFPVGESVRVPFPQQFRTRRGLEYNPSALNRRHATITFEEPLGVDFEWDSAEEALLMPRGKEKVEKEILEPAMSQIEADLDYLCAQYAGQNTASVVGALGTNPTTFDASSAAARELMVNMGCPATGDKGVIVPPAVMRALKNTAIGYMNPTKDIAKQYREGIVGYADGAEWYESPVLYRHTAGTWAGAVSVTTAPTANDREGVSTLVLTATTGDTFKKGDKFSAANVYPVHPQTRQRFNATAKTHTILADVTAASSSATITFSPPMFGPTSQYQNVDALPVASAALTLWPGTSSPNGKIGNLALMIHSNAFALVGKALQTPKASSVELVSQARDPDSGLSVRFIREWDQKSSKMTNRFDVLFGFGTFFNDSCAVVIATA